MITIYRNIEQGTAEWMALRLGIPTASAFSAVLAKGEGKTRKAYLSGYWEGAEDEERGGVRPRVV